MENDLGILKRDAICLKVFIIEPILISCIDKTSFAAIYTYVQRVSPNITESETKEHLYYLIDGSFINYIGKSKIYSLSQDGIDLLNLIYSQRIERVIGYSNLIIKVG